MSAPANLKQRVAEQLGVPADDRVRDVTDAAASWVENVARCLTDPAILWADDRVLEGTVLYAALLYQSRAAPQGFPGYDADIASLELAGAMQNVRRLVGLDPVIA